MSFWQFELLCIFFKVHELYILRLRKKLQFEERKQANQRRVIFHLLVWWSWFVLNGSFHSCVMYCLLVFSLSYQTSEGEIEVPSFRVDLWTNKGFNIMEECFSWLFFIFYFSFRCFLIQKQCGGWTMQSRRFGLFAWNKWHHRKYSSPLYLGSCTSTNRGLLYGFAFWIVCTPEIILTCTFFLSWPNTNHFTNGVWSEVVLLELS